MKNLTGHLHNFRRQLGGLPRDLNEVNEMAVLFFVGRHVQLVVTETYDSVRVVHSLERRRREVRHRAQVARKVDRKQSQRGVAAIAQHQVIRDVARVSILVPDLGIGQEVVAVFVDEPVQLAEVVQHALRKVHVIEKVLRVGFPVEFLLGCIVLVNAFSNCLTS